MRKSLFQIAILAIALSMPVLFGAPAFGSSSLDETPPTKSPPQLNAHVTVNEPVVRLGDLFSNTGDRAEVAVAYAPEPGKQLVLDARWLYRVARAYNIEWQPVGLSIQSVVERASVLVPRDEIRERILSALAGYGVVGDMEIEFSNPLQQIYLAADQKPTVRVDNINYQKRSGHFTALVVAGTERMRFSGRAYRVVEVPVLKSRVLRGDIITKSEIGWTKMKADRVQRDVIVDAEDLIGKTPKRGVRAGMPVRNVDVRRPLLVKKNSLVMVVHKVPNMVLTAQGKALQAGSNGDIIQVQNLRSKHVIEAEIIGPGQVAVRSITKELSMITN